MIASLLLWHWVFVFHNYIMYLYFTLTPNQCILRKLNNKYSSLSTHQFCPILPQIDQPKNTWKTNYSIRIEFWYSNNLTAFNMLTATKIQSLSESWFSIICTITAFNLILSLKIEKWLRQSKKWRTLKRKNITFTGKSKESFRRCSKDIFSKFYFQLTNVMVSQ